MDVAPIVDRLESELPCSLHEMTPGEWSTVLAGSNTRIRINGRAEMMQINTPIPGAHDGLPQATLIELTKLNLPNDALGQSFLATGRAAGYLDVVDAFPIASVTPAQAVDRVLDQIRASVELTERIDDARISGKSIIRGNE